MYNESDDAATHYAADDAAAHHADQSNLPDPESLSINALRLSLRIQLEAR